jgi:hypothetical protein
MKPSDIEMELRSYQSNDVMYMTPDVTDIVPIMDRIISADKILSKIQIEES